MDIPSLMLFPTIPQLVHVQTANFQSAIEAFTGQKDRSILNTAALQDFNGHCGYKVSSPIRLQMRMMLRTLSGQSYWSYSLPPTCPMTLLESWRDPRDGT